MRKRTVAVDARAQSGSPGLSVLHEAATLSIPECAAQSLGRLVTKAKADFEAGKDPDRSFREFDIGPFTMLLSLEPQAAAAALSAFADAPGTEQVAACMFVSSAILSLNHEDPRCARRCIAGICRKGRKEPAFDPLSRLVLLSIADMADRIQDSPDADPGTAALGLCCVRRLIRLSS